ncbi:MAG: endonuclease domain-containing protein [Proteobacteria bacterium]|nr:endonuclease domain-containing protein [Pseudomonadota bacterium]
MSVELAKRLRRNQTTAERLLWSRLRNRQLDGHKFRRQKPIGRYIVDFVCVESALIVEVDGGQHAEQSAKDEARSAVIKGKGFRVIRFWNNEVTKNLDGVLEAIQIALNQAPSP